MGKRTNRATGNKGEAAAAEMLAKKGYEIVKRNYGNKWGEVDIIARFKDGDVIVFVEVKTKTGQKYGEPWEMVSKWKVDQVTRMGQLWCEEYGWRGLCRVDVVGVWMDDSLIDGEQRVLRIEHWENVQI